VVSIEENWKDFVTCYTVLISSIMRTLRLILLSVVLIMPNVNSNSGFNVESSGQVGVVALVLG
jgi:hypothetical protein